MSKRPTLRIPSLQLLVPQVMVIDGVLMSQVAAIAAVCVQSEADYRPLMTDVVQSLIPLVKNSVAASPTTPSRVQVSVAAS